MNRAATPAAAFLDTLAAEEYAVSEFVDLLKLEQTALTNGKTDELPAFAEQKNTLAGKLGGLCARRNALLAGEGLGVDRAGVATWCAQHAKEHNAAAAWAHILSLSAEARELMRVNGQLIAMRMQYNSQALEALLGGKNTLDLYGPDGQTTIADSRRINDTV